MNINDLTLTEQQLILKVLHQHTRIQTHDKCVAELEKMGFGNTLETAYIKLSIIFHHYGDTGFPFPPKR